MYKMKEDAPEVPVQEQIIKEQIEILKSAQEKALKIGNLDLVLQIAKELINIPCNRIIR